MKLSPVQKTIIETTGYIISVNKYEDVCGMVQDLVHMFRLINRVEEYKGTFKIRK